MFYRASLAVLLLLSTVEAQRPRNLQPPINSLSDIIGDYTSGDAMPPPGRMLCSVRGRVTNMDGKPMGGVSVVLQDLATGNALASGRTGGAGSFVISDVASGNYEIVVSKGSLAAQQHVHISRSDVDLVFQLVEPSKAPDGSRIISLEQLKVPSKASREYELAAELLQAAKFREARKHLDRALQIAPRYASALVMRGILDVNERDPVAAENSFRQAIDLDPSVAKPYLLLGSVLKSESRFDDAARVLEHGLELDPSALQGWFELAKVRIAQKNFAEALQAATHAEELGREVPVTHLVRGYVLHSLHQYKDAIGEYEQFLSREKDGVLSDHVRDALQRARDELAQATYSVDNR